MEKTTPQDLTTKICNVLNSTSFCVTADIIKKFAEQEFILEREVGAKGESIHGKIQLPTQVTIISYFYEPYLFMLSEFEKTKRSRDDYVLENKVESMADVPLSATGLTPKRVYDSSRVFSRFPLWGRTPEQYELMVNSHLDAFIKLYSEVKDSPSTSESLRKIKDSFVNYKS